MAASAPGSAPRQEQQAVPRISISMREIKVKRIPRSPRRVIVGALQSLQSLFIATTLLVFSAPRKPSGTDAGARP